MMLMMVVMLMMITKVIMLMCYSDVRGCGGNDDDGFDFLL